MHLDKSLITDKVTDMEIEEKTSPSSSRKEEGGGKGGGEGGGGGGGGEQEKDHVFFPDGGGPHASTKSTTKPSKRGFLRRHKSKSSMSGNGFPNIVPEHLEVDCNTSSSSTFIPSIDSKFLSAQTDRTYNEMLQKRMSNNQAFNRIHSKNSIQSRVYNFLERPTGWKCFIYHFTV
ncbi:hypothetical protein V1264_015433 [Littorina saxatilis]|uniref:Uncharacterized protein n=1 Tax=Littorina saxatilis TaxID=31220 RepID=A0AAN9GGZ7_9CAEN